MNRKLEMLLALVFFCLGLGGAAFGKEKKGPVSGTWACVAHGTGQGDIEYTFNLTQANEKVTGSFSSSEEKADITDGTFKDKKLELHFDAYGGAVTIKGASAKKGEMSGEWTHSGGGQGPWECKASPAVPGKK